MLLENFVYSIQAMMMLHKGMLVITTICKLCAKFCYAIMDVCLALYVFVGC